MNPLAALTLNDALGTQDHTVIVRLGELIENCLDALNGEFLRGLLAEGGKYLVCMVVVMIVTVTATAALLAVVVMMLVVVMVSVATALLVVVVMVMVSVATELLIVVVVVSVAAALLIVIVMVSVAAALLIVVVVVSVAAALLIVVVVVSVATALLIVIVVVSVATALLIVVVVVMVVLMLILKCLYRVSKGVSSLHSGENILAIKSVPGGSHDNGGLVMLAEKSNALGNLLIPCRLGVGENDAGGVCYLIVIELAEVLHIHFALVNVGNGGKAIEGCTVLLGGLRRTDNVGQLADARGLDNNSVGVVFLKHLYKCLREIAHQRAADTARVHLSDLNARIGEKSAVNTYLAKLVLNKDDTLTCVRLLDQLLDQRGLTRTEKAGEYINFRHFFLLLKTIFLQILLYYKYFKMSSENEWNNPHSAPPLTARPFAKQGDYKAFFHE